MAKKHTVSETNETISAVITALGEGAVGIIRISGTEAAAIGDKLFRSASGKKFTLTIDDEGNISTQKITEE